MNNQITEFNKKLVNENIDINIIDYVKEINDTFFLKLILILFMILWI